MQNISAKIEFWKNRLLDLGKRNRLINCPLPADGKRVQRHSLLIETPNPSEIWTMMADNDVPLSFPVPPSKEEAVTEDAELEIESELALSDSDIKTNQTPHETHKTLRMLMKKAKEFSEEKGLNALHLAFGFLNWKENGVEGQLMRSPLLLVPVKLTQEDLFSPIVLSRSDEEISENYSLKQKLLSDFGIELPSYTEEVNLKDYLDSVAQSVKSFGWTLSNDVAQLSLFSFLKINMYRDLECNEQKIMAHHIIRTIGGEVACDSADLLDLSDMKDYNHDKSEPHEVFSVVDADSSQQDAVLLAKRGVSFVLQGPPGTGKSQTITNVIAELIADGKKVLFVSEKMAALEVVHRRLTLVGLSDFCLSLHNHKAKRREILDQLDKTIKMSRQKVNLQQEAYDRLYRLKEVRDILNKYSTDLHTVNEPLGKTIYQVNGYLSQYENFRNVDFIQENSEKFTPALLMSCESALEEVTRIVSKSGYQQNNPWEGSVLTQPPTFEFRQKFTVESEALISSLEEGRTLFENTNGILGINADFKLADVENIRLIFDCASQSPTVPCEWIFLDLSTTISHLDSCVSALERRNRAKSDLEIQCAELTAIKTSAENGERVTQSSGSISNEIISSYNIAVDSLIEVSNQKGQDETVFSEILTQLENGTAISQTSFAVSENITAYNSAIDFSIKVSNQKEQEEAVFSEILMQLENGTAISQTSIAVSESIATYNSAIDSQKGASNEKELCLERLRVIEERITQIREASGVAEKLCNDLYNDWQEVQSPFLCDFDEGLLSLNIAELLSNYRVKYRSFFKRLSSAYRRDCKDLLAHCKKPIKLTYEQGFTIVSTANGVLAKKETYAQQAEIAKKAVESLNAAETELGVATSALGVAVSSLASADEQLSAEKQKLQTAIGEAQNEAVALLNKANEQLLTEKQNLQTAISEGQNDAVALLSKTNKRLYSEQKTLLSAITEIQSVYQSELDEKEQKLHDICRDLSATLNCAVNENIDFNELRSRLQWCISFKELVVRYSLSNSYVSGVCAKNDRLQITMRENISALERWLTTVTPNYDKFLSLFDNAVKNTICDSSLSAVSKMVQTCKENFASLEYLIDYRISREAAHRLRDRCLSCESQGDEFQF